VPVNAKGYPTVPMKAPRKDLQDTLDCTDCGEIERKYQVNCKVDVLNCSK